MSVRCLMSGLEVNYPCSPVCALFGDCVTAFNAAKAQSVRTNADRIRAMSDEELAGQFVQVVKEAIKAIADADLPDGICDQLWSQFLEKLQQPVKDGGDDGKSNDQE